jgi:hypothetical protein
MAGRSRSSLQFWEIVPIRSWAQPGWYLCLHSRAPRQYCSPSVPSFLDPARDGWSQTLGHHSVFGHLGWAWGIEGGLSALLPFMLEPINLHPELALSLDSQLGLQLTHVLQVPHLLLGPVSVGSWRWGGCKQGWDPARNLHLLSFCCGTLQDLPQSSAKGLQKLQFIYSAFLSLQDPLSA